MTRLCIDPELRDQPGRTVRRSSEKYDIHRTVQLMLTSYERLIDQSRSPRRSVGMRLRSLQGKLQP